MSEGNPLPRLVRALPYLRFGGDCGIRPTFYGLVYLGMLAALLLGSINHNNNLGYLLTFLLSGLLLVSIRRSWRNVHGIEVGGGPAPPVFAGTEARFALQVRGRGEEHYGLLFALDAAWPSSVDLPAGSEVLVELALPASTRGQLLCRDLQLSSSFPFGLVECRRHLAVHLSCLVYPRPIASAFVGATVGDELEQGLSTRSLGRDFSGIAAYRPGDSLGRIHWKGFARGQGLHVVEFEEQESGGALFSLKRLPGTDLEYKLSCLCHMVLSAAAQGRRYGLDLGGLRIEAARGAPHRRRCLEALALYGVNP